MSKLSLNNVTLYGADTTNLNRLLSVFSICERFANFGAKKLFTKINENFVTESGIEIINTNEIKSLVDYNRFNMKILYEYIKTDFVLVVEYDGFILNPDAWEDEFLEYDYIGAPWWYKDGHNVGNGGFSLRSKRLLEILYKDDFINQTFPDDRHICRTYRTYLESKGIKFAPEVLARKFSIEGELHYKEKWTNTGDVWTNQFGFHGLHKTNISLWLEKYPEYKHILFPEPISEKTHNEAKKLNISDFEC